MKHRLKIFVTFAVLLVATVAIFHQSGHGQSGNNLRPSSVNSGLITVNQDQFVRLTLANAATNPSANDRLTARVNIRVAQYAPTGQQGTIQQHMVVGQTSSGPIIIPPGGGASMDFDLTQAVSPDVQSFLINIEALPFANSSSNAKAAATLTLYDKLTNQPLSVWVWVEAEGGYVWM